MVVNLCLVDSGDQTDMVYDFCVYHSEYAAPAKGASHEQLSHYKLSVINKEGSIANGMALVIVDGGKYKDMIAGRMQRGNGRGSWMVYAGCDREYAEQVTAEHKVSRKKNGVVKQVWEKKHSHGDNHYLDAEVYAMAAADIRGVRTLHLNTEELPNRKNPERSNEDDPQHFTEERWIQNNENWLK